MSSKKVFFISNSGGHLAQLLELRSIFSNFNYLIITERKESSLKLKDAYPIYFLTENPKGRSFKFYIVLILNFFLAFYLIFKEKPSVMVTTGTYTAFPFYFIARFLKIKTIYIQSYARINSATKGDFLFYRMSDVFVTQWETQMENFPKANLMRGGIY